MHNFSYQEFSTIVRSIIVAYAYNNKKFMISRKKLVLITWLVRQVFKGSKDRVLECFAPVVTKWSMNTSELNNDYNLIKPSSFRRIPLNDDKWILIPHGDYYIIQYKEPTLRDLFDIEKHQAILHIDSFKGSEWRENFLITVENIISVEEEVSLTILRDYIENGMSVDDAVETLMKRYESV